MIFTVIGAGPIGSAIVRELAAQPDVSLVQVLDLRARALQALTETLDRKRVRSFQLDARDLAPLRHILAPSTVVVGCGASAQNPALAALCVDLGLPFLDLGGPDEAVEQTLALDAAARERGVWVVPNTGIAPGLVNVLAMLGTQRFAALDTVHIRVGDIPQTPAPPFNFAAAWSVEKVLEDYTEPAETLADGQLRCVEPLTGLEDIRFPDPYGTLEAFYTQGGLRWMAQALEGRLLTLDHKTIRWPGHAAQMQFVLGLGLADRTSIDVRTHLTYRDVLLRRMRQRLSARQRDVLLARVLVRGLTPGGDRQTLVYELAEPFNERSDTTAMHRCTAVPAVVLALMLARGEVPGGGASTPELLPVLPAYVDALAAHGFAVETHVYDGYRDVLDPATLFAEPAA